MIYDNHILPTNQVHWVLRMHGLRTLVLTVSAH